MNNFEFRNPTKILFGQGQISKLSKEIDKSRKILLTYGGGSIKKNGVYDQVMQALEGYNIIEFAGIEANPDYNTLMRAVEICKKENIDFILAVGGGSIIDGTKFIATAARFEGEDAWDILLKKAKHLPEPIKFGSVLTLPATASEMNNGAVISRRDRAEKLAFHNPKGYPTFSILDPNVVLSLPKKQISNGIVDIYAHTLEQYLTTCLDTKVMDRWAESLLLTLIEEAEELMSENPSYNSCANFMLTATMGLNGFIAMGVEEDWATHMIGHELTALCGLDHGETLAIVHPALMDVMREEKKGKLLQYAKRVWNIDTENSQQAIDLAVEKTENFFRSIGKKTRLSEYNIGDDVIEEIVKRFTDRGWCVGERGIVTPEKTRQILNRAK